MRGRNRPERNVLRPMRKQSRMPASAASRSCSASGPAVERGERIGQHDLAIEPGKMIAEERPHHDVLVGLIAAHHHRPQRSLRRLAADGHVERRKGQRRRVGEIARHQEAAGRQQAHRKALVAAALQIAPEELCGRERRLLVLARLGLERCEMRVPVRGQMGARRLARQRQAFRRPLLKTLLQQRQIEQPLAGIVDDVERQRAVGAVLALVVDDEPELADVDGRARPAPLLDQRAQMALIGKARHGVVRLRRQMRPRDPARKNRPRTPETGRRASGHGSAR